MERSNGMEMLQDMGKRIPRWVVVCMASSLLFGVLIHGFMLTNKLPNHDDIAFLDSMGYTLVSGRWFLGLLGSLCRAWSMPWVNGLAAILCIGGSACLMLEILSQRDVVSAGLLPFLLLAFPSTANIFSYMYFAGIYFFGVLLTCAGVYCLVKFPKAGIPVGVLLIACAMGIYQSYICLAAGLLLLWVAKALLEVGEEKRALWGKILRALVLLIFSVGVYLLILRICLRLFGTELLSYQGISSMGNFDLAAIPSQCVKAYRAIADFFVLDPPAFVPGLLRAANGILLLLMAGMLVCVLIWSKGVSLWRKGLSVCALGLLPLALAGIYVIAPQSNAHMVMVYQYVLFYVAGLFLLERFLRLCPMGWGRRAVAVLALVCLLLGGLEGALVDNRAYLASRLAFDKAFAFYNRMVLRIEDSGCFRPGDILAIVGPCHQDFFGEEAIFPELEGMTGFDKAADMLDYDAGARHNFITSYVGLNAAYDDYYQWNWRSVPEIVQMPAYPEEGSICRVGNAVIVKMGD